MFIHQLAKWPKFEWAERESELLVLLAEVRHLQGLLSGRMSALGFDLQSEALLSTLTSDVMKTSEIEGEILNLEQVRSSIARHLHLEVSGLVASDRNTDGVVQMMVDATQNFKAPLTSSRLFAWHAGLFPTGHSGIYLIEVGKWRTDTNGPMQVISGGMGREVVHFVAPSATRLELEMIRFLDWFASVSAIDPVMKAAIAHIWFITIHPFDDGNGRIARTIADMQLARSENSHLRFYSMSAQIKLKRKEYYQILEDTQRGDLDISEWVYWFLACLKDAILASDHLLGNVLDKAKYWKTHANKSINERQKVMVNRLWDGFEGNLTSSKWAKMTKCSPDTALRDIQDLIAKNMLEKAAESGRSTHYKLKHVL